MGKIFDIDYKTFSEIELDILTFIFLLNFDNDYSGLNFCRMWEIAWERYERYDDIFTMNEMFFRCHKNPGEQYATAEMMNHNNNQLRGYMLKRELDKKKYSVTGFKRDTKLS